MPVDPAVIAPVLPLEALVRPLHETQPTDRIPIARSPASSLAFDSAMCFAVICCWPRCNPRLMLGWSSGHTAESTLCCIGPRTSERGLSPLPSIVATPFRARNNADLGRSDLRDSAMCSLGGHIPAVDGEGATSSMGVSVLGFG